MFEFRLFIALEIPPNAQQKLVGVQQSLKSARGIRWSNPANLHLTLQFLGDTSLEKVSQLENTLQKTVPAINCFALQFGQLGVFPNFKRPQIIWVGVSAEQKTLQTLHKAVINATQSLGFEPEKRPFKPHLTIGRLHKWAKRQEFQILEQTIQRNQRNKIAEINVTHIALIRSQLKPAGPIYTSLAKIKLGYPPANEEW